MPSTLNDIRLKVRRVTKSPSENQITTSQIDEYINNFYLYDLPEHLRLFNLRENYTFTALPNIEKYNFDTTNYISVHPPAYVAGYQCYFTQSQDEFYRLYPKVRNFEQIGVGDGATLNFTYTLSNVPVMSDAVLINTVDGAGNPLNVNDDGSGNLTGDGVGTINYVTGAINVTFTAAPGTAEQITAQTVPYAAQRPAAILFFNDQFILRPIPDQSYTVQLVVYKRPTILLNAADNPQVHEWWQLIAMGASLRIFEDRGDINSINQFRPIFDEYMRLCLRRTIVQQTNERTATIYTDFATRPFGNYYAPF